MKTSFRILIPLVVIALLGAGCSSKTEATVDANQGTSLIDQLTQDALKEAQEVRLARPTSTDEAYDEYDEYAEEYGDEYYENYEDAAAMDILAEEQTELEAFEDELNVDQIRGFVLDVGVYPGMTVSVQHSGEEGNGQETILILGDAKDTTGSEIAAWYDKTLKDKAWKQTNAATTGSIYSRSYSRGTSDLNMTFLYSKEIGSTNITIIYHRDVQ